MGNPGRQAPDRLQTVGMPQLLHRVHVGFHLRVRFGLRDLELGTHVIQGTGDFGELIVVGESERTFEISGPHPPGFLDQAPEGLGNHHQSDQEEQAATQPDQSEPHTDGFEDGVVDILLDAGETFDDLD